MELTGDCSLHWLLRRTNNFSPPLRGQIPELVNTRGSARIRDRWQAERSIAIPQAEHPFRVIRKCDEDIARSQLLTEA